MKIIIIGAGLGGLALAVSLRSETHRHDVVVIDSAPELAEIGAGLQLTPNASRLLDRWDVRQHLEKLVSDPKVFTVLRYDGQKTLAERQNYGAEMRSKYGANFWDVHRADLQIALFERAKSLGVEFRFGCFVTKHDFEERHISLANGETLRGDLIVAADGLWSKSRESFLGRPSPPIPTGDLAYRVLLQTKDIDDAELREFTSIPRVCCWVGPDCHVMYYPLKGNTMCNIVLLVPDNLPEGVAKSQGDLNEMHAIFEDWDPRLKRLLSYVKKVDKWKLMHLDELDQWYNEKASVVFLGDSCHPMLPYMAQGAGSALEDGAALGILLARANSQADLPATLKLYQAIRKDRSSALQKGSMKQRHFNHLHDGAEQEARDKLFQTQFSEPEADFPSYWLNPADQEFVYGYDVYAELRKAGVDVKQTSSASNGSRSQKASI